MANSENSADLIVNLVAKTQKHVNVDVDPWYNPWWAGLWGPYGYNGYWGAPNVRKYHDGTLIIDLVNRKNNTLVWQGMGEGLNLYKLSDKVERIPKAVNEILYFYPPKNKFLSIKKSVFRDEHGFLCFEKSNFNMILQTIRVVYLACPSIYIFLLPIDYLKEYNEL